MDFNEGEIIYIDKPLHWTSFDVVKRTAIPMAGAMLVNIVAGFFLIK